LVGIDTTGLRNYAVAMASESLLDGRPRLVPPREQPEERARRIEAEREKIDRARAQARAGLYLSGAELDAWLTLYETTDGPVPLPPRLIGKRV
jgi:hypothetical protein